ncbi:MAG: hypothetical protein WCK82_12040 [Bacteroidota bacterium]
MRKKIKVVLFISIIAIMCGSCEDNKTKTALQFYNVPVDSIKDAFFSLNGVLAFKDSSILVGLSRWNDDMENYQTIDFEQLAYIYTSNNHGNKFTKQLIGKGQLSNFSKTKNSIYTVLHVLKPDGHYTIHESKVLKSSISIQTWDTVITLEKNITQIMAFTDDTIAYIENVNGFEYLYLSTDGLATSKHVLTGGYIRNIELKNGHIFCIHHIFKDSIQVYPQIQNYEIKNSTVTQVKIPSSFEAECFNVSSSGHLMAVGTINGQYFFYESEHVNTLGHFTPLDQSHLGNPFKIYIENDEVYIISEDAILIRKNNDSNQWFEYIENISSVNGSISVKNKHYMVGSLQKNEAPSIYIIR